MIRIKFRNHFFAGLLVLVPLVITILVLRSVFLYLDNFLRPLLEPRLGFWPTGLGLIIMVLLIWLVGLLAGNMLISRAIHLGEKIMFRIPVAKLIYSAIKQLMETLSPEKKQSFQRVVLVEYPGKDLWSVGFVNGEIKLPGEAVKRLNVLIVAAINPASGFLVIVPEDKTIPLSISVEEGLKWVVSGGIIKPELLHQ